MKEIERTRGHRTKTATTTTTTFTATFTITSVIKHYNTVLLLLLITNDCHQDQLHCVPR